MAIYLRGFVFGIAAAVVAAVLWIVVAFLLPVVVPYVIGRVRGSGGISAAYLSGNSVLIAAIIGFLVAFVWRLRFS